MKAPSKSQMSNFDWSCSARPSSVFLVCEYGKHWSDKSASKLPGKSRGNQLAAYHTESIE